MASRASTSSGARHTQPVNEAIQHCVSQMFDGGASCADMMGTLCRDRTAEIAALPVPLAAELVRSCVRATTYAVAVGGAPAQEDALTTLQHLLNCPLLREVAVKVSRLKSLSTWSVKAAPWKCDGFGADAAAAAVLRRLRDVGVDIASAGTLEPCITPLIAALQRTYLGTAQLLLDAGSDVNGRSNDCLEWPLRAAARAGADAGMTWVLERGASLTVVDATKNTIAHVLAIGELEVWTRERAAEFFCHWLRRVIAAAPSLLEACDEEGYTPLMAAADAGSEAGVATLLELRATLDCANAAGTTALSLACLARSLNTVRRLIAAGAASATILPPGSLRAREATSRALWSARFPNHGKGACAPRCGSTGPCSCVGGLDILRAVLAAGVREAVGPSDRSLVFEVLPQLADTKSGVRISAGYALLILETLQAGGVDTRARGSKDTVSALEMAVLGNAPEVVRWLVTEMGAPLEARNSTGDTPFLFACAIKAWAAAHALLDLGSRVDVQSLGIGADWPVTFLARYSDGVGCSVLRRVLAADSDSLLRCSACNLSVLQLAAPTNASAMRVLLGCGLPHLAGVINLGNPLLTACMHANWGAALALLGGGARVDILGDVRGRIQTVAEWARGSGACRHHGLKVAIAARAREHEARHRFLLAKNGAARGKLRGSLNKSSDSHGPSATSTTEAVNVRGVTNRAVSANAGAGADSPDVVHAGAGSAREALTCTAAARTQAKSRKARKGASGNRAEELFDVGTPAAEVACADIAGAGADATETEAAASARPITCEEGSAALTNTAAADGHIFPQLCECCVRAVCLPGDYSAARAATAGASSSCVQTSAQRDAAVGFVAGSCLTAGVADSGGNTFNGAANDNTCEPGVESETGVNGCEQGEASIAAVARVSTSCPETAGCGTAADSSDTAALLLAALRDEATPAAAARRHLATLSDLAQDPTAAVSLEAQGALTAIGSALGRHGAPVARAAHRLLTQLIEAAADFSENGEASGDDE